MKTYCIQLKSRTCLLGAFFLFLVALVPWAGAIEAGANWDIHMDIPDVVANDFHVEGILISGDPNGNWSSPPVLVSHIDDLFVDFSYSIYPDYSSSEQNVYLFRADWSGADYKYCDILHLGLMFDLECHNLILDVVGWWTVDGEPIGEFLLPGYRVFDNFQNPFESRLSLHNDTAIDGQVTQLFVTVLSPEEVGLLFGTKENMFQEMRKGGALDPLNGAPPVPWSKGVKVNEAGFPEPIEPVNPQDFPAESFFDVFFEIEFPEPGMIGLDPPFRVAPGDVVVAAEEVTFINNAGAEEIRWTWEIHQTHGLDFGDAPDQNYQTLLASDGARHVAQGVYLGQYRDSEPDGQPSGNADGDDLNPPAGPDDEDGVQIIGTLFPGGGFTLNLTTSTSCSVNAWADWNRDGDFADPGEHVIPDTLFFAGGTITGQLTVPPTAVPGPTYMRFRVCSQSGVQSFGFAPDGEVEDYLVVIEEQQIDDRFDWGDAPDGFAAPGYPTLAANNGANHLITGLRLGPSIDPEPDGQPNLNADGDDLAGAPPDDEDGVVFNNGLVQGQQVKITVTASGPGILNAWADWNQNNSWADLAEHIFIDQPLAAGASNLVFNVPPTALPGSCYLRFRFSTAPGLNVDGPAPDGEVEDYLEGIEEGPAEVFDFGDAPDSVQVPGYPTLLVNNGARHALGTGIFLGPNIDPEADGQPNVAASGDDLSGTPDDEDGVRLVYRAIQGQTTQVEVNLTAPGAVWLNAWADYDADSTWLAADEHIFIDLPLAPGINVIDLPIPDSAAFGKIYFRFRVSTTPGLSFVGPAADGEVEDYRFEVCLGVQPFININASNDVVLSWKPVPGASSYVIYGSSGLGSFPSTWTVLDPSVLGTSWIDTGWLPRQFYMVVAQP